MTSSDLLNALSPVVDTLEELGVPYYVGGSLASSAHGVPRASIDADVIADLGPEHVGPFTSALARAYYLSQDRIKTAVQTRPRSQTPGQGVALPWAIASKKPFAITS